MATWQFDLHLLPRTPLTDLYSVRPEFVRGEMFDSVAWWDGHQPPADFESVLGTGMPRGTSWDPAVVTWGTDKGDRVMWCAMARR